MSLSGVARWAKMTTPIGKLAARVCHLTKEKTKISNQPLFINIELNDQDIASLGQSYKTFNVCNLLIFAISLSVCP
jgi:hypothetical protein